MYEHLSAYGHAALRAAGSAKRLCPQYVRVVHHHPLVRNSSRPQPVLPRRGRAEYDYRDSHVNHQPETYVMASKRESHPVVR